ncbi:MAG: hypothetical protein P1V51_20120 [Deltaproteobacteria bacterium]|nr:hypothetical protein [Deltaproteobacteria bacterium]
MESVTELLDYLKEGIEASDYLKRFALALKADEPGTTGAFAAILGNEHWKSKQIPLSLHPFVIISTGDEKERREMFAGTKIRREFRFIGGVLDNSVERCSKRIVSLGEILAHELRHLLGAVEKTPDEAGASSGMIDGFDILPLQGDGDRNRPAAYVAVPVTIAYFLEG